MEPTVWFTVAGIAQAQGSMRPFVYTGKDGQPRASMHSENRRPLNAWRDDVTKRALVARRSMRPLTGAVRVVAVCHLPRPKSVTRPAPTVKPDVDKLVRALLDAMTGVLYVDDAQITELQVKKVYAGAGESPRVDIAITALPEGTLL